MTAKHFDTYRYDGLWLEVHMGVWSPKVAADLQAYLTTNIAWRQGETALVRKDGTPSIRRVSQLYGEPLRAPIYTVRYQGQVRGEHSALCALVSPFHPTIICNGMPVTAPILVSHRPVLPWADLPRLRDEVVQRAAEIAKEEFTVGIIQCYRTGKTGIDPHRDKEMVRGTMIAGVSLGAERRLHMSRCAREWFFSLPDSKASFSSDTTARWTEKACTCMFTANGAPHTRRTLDIALPSGSLYIFRPPTNDQWLHSIPKDERIREPRLSITLRNYRSTAEDMQHHLAERPVQPPLSPARLVAVEPPLFDVASELPAAQAYLREHGLVVFANVLSPDECTEAMRRFWDFCEACDKSISRRDSRTWTNAAWPSSLGTGIVSAYGIGSSDFMWYVRTRPALLALFERYWNTSRLLCSLDGCGVYRSAEHAFSPNRAWLHADVNLALLPPLPLDSPLPTVTHSVQGQVNLLPVTGTETGSFCWIDGSHRVYADEARQGKAAPESTLLGSNADKKGHYCLLPGNHPLAQQSVSIFGHLPAGSCVLWDSALVHANIAPTTFASDSSRAPLPPAAKRMRRDPEQPSLHRFFQQGPKAPSPPPQLRRLTAYVTMAPASNVAPDALAALGDNHVKAAVQGITTSHWPDVPWSVDARKRDAAPLAACRGRVFSPREEALLRGR